MKEKQFAYYRFLAIVLIASTSLLTSCFGPKNLITQQSDIPKFKIKKGQLGKIKIGMTLAEADRHLSGFRQEVSEASLFGFGGGSPAYLYYWKDEIVLGLIPKLDTDTLLFLIAAHPKLRTTNGLNPKSSINELLQQYPHLMVMQDLMNEWEFFQDKKNGWDFIFMTDRETEVGEYIKDDIPAKPKRLNTKMDWITIREVRSE